MNKILITGGSGFIASHFHEVIEHNKIINLDLKEPIFKCSSKFIQGDVRKQEDVEHALDDNVDIILALAAEHKDFGLTEEDYFKTNEYGTQVICDAASKKDIKCIIFYSSVAVYGANKTPSDEKMTPAPNLPYGASKLAGEKVLKKWMDEDETRSVIIIRPTVVYGERNVANMFRLIQQIKGGKYFHIGKGSNVKSIAYVKNLVEATMHLIANREAGMSIYNYADEPQMTSRQIADVITSSLKRKSPITIPYGLAYLMGLPFDFIIKITGKDIPISTNRIKKFCTQTYHKAEKIREQGFKPSYSNTEGLQRMVDWQKNRYKKFEKYYDV